MGIDLKLTGEWQKAKAALAAAPAELDEAIQTAIASLAEWIAGRVKTKIASNIAPVNSPFTTLLKKSSKTLINHADLRNATAAVKIDKYNFFVGIPAAAVSRTGEQTARLADILENGRTIVMQMTDKQRKWLHANLGAKVQSITRGASTGILVIHIPARPFIKPVFDEEQEEMQRRFESRLKYRLKKLAG